MTSDSGDEFDALRAEADPISRGRRATDLLNVYQQRSTELARLRRQAIDEARRDRGLSYTEIAEQIGISKGRVTQIRQNAPSAERAFFGVGPVTVGVPYRYQITDRSRPLIAAEDAKAGEQVQELLRDLAFIATPYEIEPERELPPDGDTVVICGPKSAPVAERLMSRDPVLRMSDDGGRWRIEHQPSGERFESPSDDEDGPASDIAYVSRHIEQNRVIVHIAGIHAIGSLGVAHYLAYHLADIFTSPDPGAHSFVVGCEYDGLEILDSRLLAGPYAWEKE